MLRSGGLLILRRYADRLAGQRLVAVHVGDCEPVLLKRFFKKRDAQIVRFMDLAAASYRERARLSGVGNTAQQVAAARRRPLPEEDGTRPQI